MRGNWIMTYLSNGIGHCYCGSGGGGVRVEDTEMQRFRQRGSFTKMVSNEKKRTILNESSDEVQDGGNKKREAQSNI